MNKLIKTDNKYSAALTFGLFASINALNFCTKISACALIFTLIIGFANIAAELYGRKTALLGTIASSVVSLIILWNFDYKINGIITDGVVLMSLISTCISVYIGTSILKINLNLSFHKRNLISFIACAFTDGIMMSVFFANKFSNDKILANFSKEIFFKMVYFTTAYLIFFAVSNICQNINKKANSTIL